MAKKKSQRIAKPVSLVPIASREEADQLLRRIGELQLQVQTYEAEAEKEITEIQSQLQDHTTPLHESIEQYRKSLEAYATANRGKLFGKKKSLQLQFGRIGWKKGNPTLEVDDEDGLVDLIRRRLKGLAKQLIRIKESADKTALKKLSTEQLARIGCRLEATERFYAETEPTESVDYGDTHP